MDVQCDFTAGAGEHIGHAGAHVVLHNPECDECQPGEFEVISEESDDPDWGECDQQDFSAAFNEENCYECRTITTTVVEFNGCERRTTTTTDPKRRTVDCPGCQDSPTLNSLALSNTNGNPLRASSSFSGEGEWRLKILADRNGRGCHSSNPFEKRNVKKTLECGENGTLNTDYSWRGHGSNDWWAESWHNDVFVDRTDCVKNPFD